MNGYAIRSLVVLGVCVLSISIEGQRQTIPQAVASGARGRTRTAPSGRPPDVAEVLRQTNVIVRGIVGQPISRLSDDEFDVYTDYEILDSTVLYADVVFGTAKAGAAPAVVVTQLGGTAAVNGIPYTQKEEGLDPLRSGMEAVFLLERVDGKLQIAGTFFGVFEISGGDLRPLTSRDTFALEYRGVQATAAVDDLVARLRAIRQGF